MGTATETRTEKRAAPKMGVPVKLRQRIQIRAAAEGMTMREYVSAMLRLRKPARLRSISGAGMIVAASHAR